MVINLFGLLSGFRREITGHICRTGENGYFVLVLKLKLRSRVQPQNDVTLAEFSGFMIFPRIIRFP